MEKKQATLVDPARKRGGQLYTDTVLKWICIVHQHKHASNVLPHPIPSPSARHQRTLQDHGYSVVYHAMCLFTPSGFAEY